MGVARELFTWEDIASMYAKLTAAARALIGVHLRKVDLPADLGLAEEGFAVLLSRPRDQEALTAADVSGVAARYEREIWRVLRETLPLELSRRVMVHVGGGLVRRPTGGETVVEAVIAGLGDAYEDAITKQDAHLRRLATGVRSAGRRPGCCISAGGGARRWASGGVSGAGVSCRGTVVRRRCLVRCGTASRNRWIGVSHLPSAAVVGAERFAR